MERDSLCDSMLMDKMGHILILDGNTDLDLQTCWNFALLRQVTTQAIKNLFRLGRFGQAIVEKGTDPHADRRIGGSASIVRDRGQNQLKYTFFPKF